MRKIVWAFIIGLVLVSTSCSRADEDLRAINTPEAADVFITEVSSRIVSFTTTEFCGGGLPPGVEFTLQVVTIKAQVNWLGQGKCTGGLTPRQCAAGNLDPGKDCSQNSECDLAATGDMAGTCGPRPCRIDSDCQASSNTTDPDDLCGTAAARLVFASALIDPKTLTEVGVILFDNGEKLVELNDGGGNPVGIQVRTGDEVSRDQIYTRQFAIFNTTSFPAEDCIALAPIVPTLTPTDGVTSLKVFGQGLSLDFKVDAVDTVSGAARLTTVESGLPIATVPMCCKIFGFELCNQGEPACATP